MYLVWIIECVYTPIYIGDLQKGTASLMYMPMKEWFVTLFSPVKIQLKISLILLISKNTIFLDIIYY